MELSLVRQDIYQVSSTCRKTLRLLPPGKKRRQQLVVGDDTGSIVCFGVRKDGQTEQVFRTPPVQRGEVGRVELAGAPEAGGKDKIFYCSGPTVHGYSKKGKEFLRFSTNLAEPIRSLHVDGDDLHTGGEYIYNHFVNCKDSAFFMANDR